MLVLCFKHPTLQCSEKVSCCVLQRSQGFHPFHIHQVETLVINPVILLSCHSCLYYSSALNASIDKIVCYSGLRLFDALLFATVCPQFLSQGCRTLWGK